MKRSIWNIVLVGFLILAGFVSVKNKVFEWTTFRGTGGMGIDTQLKAPTVWDSTDYCWEIKLEGKGNASPVVWGDKIFITSSDDEQKIGFLFAIKASEGIILWKKQFRLTDLPLHPNNTMSSATPAVDEFRIYVIWYTKHETKLIALAHDGSIQWETKFDGIESRHGGGSSLMLAEDNVIFTREQEEGSSVQSSWVAVDRQSGETAWELDRETSASNSFSTPILIKGADHEAQLVFSSFAHGFTSVNPLTGQINWERQGMLKHRVVGSPIYANGLLLGCYKGGGAVLDVDFDAKQISDTIHYAIPRSVAPYVPTPIVVGDLLFLFMDGGVVSCLRFSTGEVLWKERPSGALFGSPICVGGVLYCITKDGKVLVIQAKSSYQLVGIYDLGEGSFSTPAMCNEGLLFRTFSKLILVDNS